MWFAVADVILSAILSLMVGAALLTLRKAGDRTDERDRLLRAMESDLRSLREGISAGAREAFTQLNGRLNVLEDAHDQLTDRVGGLGTDVRVIERVLDLHPRMPDTRGGG